MSGITALVDADLVAYRCAASCEEDSDSDSAIYRCNNLVETIIDSVGASDYTLYLTGSGNFRYAIDPNYKAHRKDKPKPKWLQTCREFLVTKWNAKVTDGIEADDALAIAQHENSYICSLDKDLLQIPGMHFNWVKNEEYYITHQEGLYNFWTQTIVGDVADNIQGIRGLGPKKTAPILDQVRNNKPYHDDVDDQVYNTELNRAYYNCVAALYNDNDRLHRNCKLLHLQRYEGDIWVTPDEREAKIMESTALNLKKTSRKSSNRSTLKRNTNQIESSLPSPVV